MADDMFLEVNEDEEQQAPTRAATLAAPDDDEGIPPYRPSWQPDPLRQAAGIAAKTGPDTAAKIFDLQRKTNLPYAVVERNLAEVSEKVAAGTFDPTKLRNEAPKLAGWLENEPAHTALVQDDLVPLTGLERTLAFPGKALESLEAGVHQVGKMAWGAVYAAAESGLVQGSADQVAMLSEFSQGAALIADALAAKARPDTEGAGFIEKAALSGIESIPVSLATMAVGAVAGPAVGVGAFMGAGTVGASYVDARVAGLPHLRALGYGGVQGIVEAATEYIPTKWFLGDLAKNAGFVKLFAHQLGGEAFGEQAATALQDLNDWATLPINKDKPFQAYLDERPSAAAQTLIATITMVGSTTVGAGVTRTLITKLGKDVTESKTAQRSPEKFKELVGSMAPDKPLFQSTAVWRTYWEAKGVDPAVMADTVTGQTGALALAETANAMLEIPVGRYATTLAGTEHNAFFAEELTLDPNVENAREAQVTQQARLALMDVGQSLVDSLTQARDNPVTELGGELQQTVRAQLEATPGFQAMAAKEGVDVGVAANTFAAGIDAVITKVAQRLGQTPAQVLERAGLQSAAQLFEDTPVTGRDSGVPVPVDATALTDAQLETDVTSPDLVVAERAMAEIARRYGGDVEGDDLEAEEAPADAQAAPGAPIAPEDGSGAPAPAETPLEAPGARLLQAAKAKKATLPKAPKVVELDEDGNPIKKKTKPPKEPDLPSWLRAPWTRVAGRLRLSTRVPDAMQAGEATTVLRTDLSVLAASHQLPAVADRVGRYPQVTNAQKTLAPAERVEAFIGQGIRNLRFLWNLMPAEQRERAKLWYVGAHRISLAMADEWGYTPQQAAAILAVMSPKADWFKNVAWARVGSKVFAKLDAENLMFDDGLFGHYRKRVLATFDRETRRKEFKKALTKGLSEDAAHEVVAGKRALLVLSLDREQALHQGVAWHDLTDQGQARMLRAYVEIHESPAYPIIMPEGENADLKRTTVLDKKSNQYVPAKMGWTTFGVTANAISLMRDGSTDNLQFRLGGEHKVRSFFNNIADPWNPNAVTIDTHAVAAAHLEPFSSEAPQVKATMGGNSDADLGLSGINAVYAEMYFRLADELSAELGRPVLPREVQSVTWEMIRLIYSPEEKRGDAPARALGVWRQFAGGTLSEEAVHAAIAAEPGRVSAPDWAHTPARVAVDEGQLREGHGVPLFPDVPARRRDVGQDSRGSGGPPADLLGRFGLRVEDYPDPVSWRRSSASRVLGDFHRRKARVYVRGSGRGAEALRGLVYVPHEQVRAEFAKVGYPAPTVHELHRTPENAAFFHAQISAAKRGSKYGAAVFVYDAADYEGMRLFVTEDDTAGFAIKPDGDIVSVFSGGGGYVHAMLALATAEGGTKLDNFDTALSDLYAVNGFRVVDRQPWDDQYAPEGWSTETFGKYNAGKPDVVYMQYDPVGVLQTSPAAMLYQSAAPAPPQTGVAWAYSRLTRAVEASTLTKASGAQWKATIKNTKAGINADEFLFAHVDDLVNGTTYTRQEVLDYLATNQLQVEWHTFQNQPGPSRAELQAEAQRIYDWNLAQAMRVAENEGQFTEPEPSAALELAAADARSGQDEWTAFVDGDRVDWGFATEAEAYAAAVVVAAGQVQAQQEQIRRTAEGRVDWDDAEATALENLTGGEPTGTAPFAEYVEPGGDEGTYREVLLHAPQFGTTGFAVLTAAENQRLREGLAPELRQIREAVGPVGGGLAPEPALKAQQKVLSKILKGYDKQIADPVTPLRDREVAQLQADRAILLKLQAAGDFTYRTAGWKDGHAAYDAVANPIVRLRYNQRTLADGRRALFLEEVQPPQETQQQKMPPLLLKNWREVAFKWALAHGADLGVDVVAWTSGAMQANRYDLARAVTSVRWTTPLNLTPDADGRYTPGHNRTVTVHLESADQPLVLYLDTEQRVVQATEGEDDDGRVIEQYDGRTLSEILGKHFAQRVAEVQHGDVAGEDLSVGGDGLKKLYDDDFRNVVNKLPAVKKSGGRVAGIVMTFAEPASGASYTTVPSGLGGTVHVRAEGGALFDGYGGWTFDPAVAMAYSPTAAAGQVERMTKPPSRDAEVPAIVLTPEVKAAVQQGQALFQAGQPVPKDAPRAFFRGRGRFGGAARPNIGLLAGADLSSVVHELGHFYLELLGDLTDDLRLKDPTTLAPGQAGVLKDYQTILAWLGVADRHGIGVAQHEKYAEAWEEYAREGKAPSSALKVAFGRMRTWLLAIYPEFRSVLTDEVRGVFDRMQAADEAVVEAQDEAQIEPYTTAAIAGMHPVEFEAYRETVRKANDAARDTLQQGLMKQLQADRTKAWKARRVEVLAEVTADVHARPVQWALSILTTGKQPNGQPGPKGSEGLKLSKASIVARYGENRLKTLPKPWVYSVDDGLDVELVAGFFGYGTGDQLLTALAGAEKADVVIAREVAARMQAEVGDMRLDGTLEATAKRAVQENGHDAVLALELKALAKKVREVAPFVRARVAVLAGEQRDVDEAARAARLAQLVEDRATVRAAQAALDSVLPVAEVRAIAEGLINAQTVQQIRPSQYWVAARNAGRASLAAAVTGRYEEALAQKQKQLLAVELYRAATAAQAEVAAVVRYAQRFDQPGPRARLGKAGDSYLDQVDAILEQFEFKTVTDKALKRRASLLEWMKQRQDEGLDTSGIPAELIATAQRTNYKQLTLEELRAIRDAVKQIASMASLKNRLLNNERTRNFVKVRDGLVAQAETLPAREAVLEYRGAALVKHKIAQMFAGLAKVARLARALDGYVEGGAFWSAIIRPLNAAADTEQTRKRKEGKAYGAVIRRHYPGTAINSWQQTAIVPGVGALSLEARLAIALNWGNASSRDRVLSDPSLKLDEAKVEAIFDTLSRNDLLFVQATWDFVDSFWQEITDKQQRVTGLRPEKVAAVSVTTKHGTFRGGYYPLKYDSRKSDKAGQHEAAALATSGLQAAYVVSTTARGHIKAREDHVELPLRLDLGVMFDHVEQVIHDLTHHETLIDLTRLLRDRQVSAAIIERAGKPVLDQFTSMLDAVATGGKPTPWLGDGALRHMRTGAQTAAMGFSFWTAVQQPLGLFNGAATIGPVWMARGLTRWLRDAASMENTLVWIREASPLMAGRATTATQDLADLRQQLQKPGGWFDRLLRTVTLDVVNQQNLMDSYLWHIGLMQRVADVPTWLGGYEKAMASGVDEKTAIALADQGVLDSQGGGQIKDLAAVQRGPEAAKLFMLFYSYGNTVYNSTAEAAGRARHRGTPLAAARLVGDLGLLIALPAMASVMLSRLFGRSGDEDDEWGVWTWDMAQEMLAATLNTVPIVRELGGLLREGNRGYEGPAGTRMLQLVYRTAAQVKQGEADVALFKALNATGGVLLRYPASQVQKTIDGFVALEEGRTRNPFALLVGAPKD